MVVSLRSRVGLGTAPFGSSPGWRVRWGNQDVAESIPTIHAALDAGISRIDTAPMYGWGRAEEIVGQATKDRRDQVTILTKCGTVPQGDFCREDHSPQAIRADVENSLLRLQTDHVDVLQIHDPSPDIPIEESWGVVMDVVREGKALAGGLSNHSPALMDRADKVGPISVVQWQYSLLERSAEPVIGWCREREIPFLAWSPLASGFLADDFDMNSLEADDFRRSHRSADPRYTGAISDWRSFVAGDLGSDWTATEAALSWVISRPGVYAIVGARTPDEARIAAATRTVPAEVRDQIGEGLQIPSA